jgi:NDP-sugar pyrophosphorylase family protein
MDYLAYITLIPAAGECTRFRKAGYMLPKGLIRLEWGGSEAPMIEHVADRDHSVTVVCKAQDYNLFKRKLSHMNVIPIASSEGQAHTVYQGLAMDNGERPLLVINCDNSFDIDLNEFVSECQRTQAACGAVVFDCEQMFAKYGYVDACPWFTRGAEKNAISIYALAGAFYFASGNIFRAAFQQSKDTACYISSLFSRIEGNKLAYRIQRSQLHEWGTPEDIRADKTVKGFE